MSDEASGVCQTRANVVRFQPGVALQHDLRRIAGGQHAEDMLDGQTTVPDDRLAAEDGRVRRDSTQKIRFAASATHDPPTESCYLSSALRISAAATACIVDIRRKVPPGDAFYGPPVYDAAPLIVGQLVFAFGFDLLLGWSRRDAHRLGFGPVPVIFSINLFLWFTDDWFHFQFLLVAIGFAAKELICWERDGRLVHIFNPASFPLAVFALALIVTGMSDVTRAQDIAISQFYPPQMYLWIFLIALPGQYLFGVTTMTMAAVVSTYLFGLLYFAVTGVYFFYDSYIPIAVFLGMHLLFTDPSTSPRAELGRIAFGVLYGLSTVVLYVVLGRAGAPTFYDKLLQVPLLNLSVIAIDRAARSTVFRRFDPAALGRALAPRRRHLAYMGVWAVVFAAISAAGGVGDRHPGSGCCSGSRPVRKGGRMRAASYSRSRPGFAIWVRDGRATRRGCCRWGSPGMEGLGRTAKVAGRSRRCSRSSGGVSSRSMWRVATIGRC